MAVTPKYVRLARPKATSAASVCVSNSKLRRSTASATTPLIIENTTTGATRPSPTSPSTSAFLSDGTSSEMCQSSAAFCMNVPENDTSNPIQISRKFRCCRATSEAGQREASRGACSSRASTGATLLSDVEEVNVEDQRRVWRDRPNRLIPVPKIRRNDQGTPSADAHAVDSLVPAGDHPSDAEREDQRGPARAQRAVELDSMMVGRGRAVDPARVVDRELPAVRSL